LTFFFNGNGSEKTAFPAVLLGNGKNPYTYKREFPDCEQRRLLLLKEKLDRVEQ
jgi:hypothetical protein